MLYLNEINRKCYLLWRRNLTLTNVVFELYEESEKKNGLQI